MTNNRAAIEFANKFLWYLATATLSIVTLKSKNSIFEMLKTGAQGGFDAELNAKIHELYVYTLVDGYNSTMSIGVYVDKDKKVIARGSAMVVTN